MKLVFIGTDGSMGLTTGKTYTARVTSDERYIWVSWNKGSCCYSSPQTFAKNWAIVRD